MAAKIAGVCRVVIPKLNERDLAEVPEALRDGIHFERVEHMDQVLRIALAASRRRSGRRRRDGGPSRWLRARRGRMSEEDRALRQAQGRRCGTVGRGASRATGRLGCVGEGGRADRGPPGEGARKTG